jgi:hypothetical protein
MIAGACGRTSRSVNIVADCAGGQLHDPAPEPGNQSFPEAGNAATRKKMTHVGSCIARILEQ